MKNVSCETIKNKIKRFFPLLNILTVFVDFLVCNFFISFGKRSIPLCIIGYVYLIFICFRCFMSLYRCISSKIKAREYLDANRVLPVEGKQRVGKTSFCSWLCSLNKVPVFTNVPIRIKGRFTKKISTDILSLDTKLPENSIIYIDECNLYYNNLRNGKSTENNNIFGQSIYNQCVGHFTDGNVIYSSTYTDKLPKEIRVNFSCRAQVLEQGTYNFSFIGSALLKLICRFFRLGKVHTGLRRWRVQHYEKIHSVVDEDGIYTVDLGNSNSKFAPCNDFYALNSYSFEYNDRYMRGLYDILPDCSQISFDNLNIDISDASLLYDAEVFKYMLTKY